MLLKYTYVPNQVNMDFQKENVNFTFLYDIITLGIPCSLNIYLIKISTICNILKVDWTRIKCVDLLNLSTTTIIESFYLFVSGSPVIKLSVMTSHFHSRIGNESSNPVGH